MKKLKELTAVEIKPLSYTDFVGLINQWNVPPGALSTVNKWRVFSELNENSNLLEMACTTGFSSRELALLSGCRAVGIDISGASVEAANESKAKYAPDANLEYHVADAYAYKESKPFTHIVLGAALKFFPDPYKLLQHAVNLFDGTGYVLASPFYIHEPIPADLIEKFQAVFGITPTLEGYKDIVDVYKGLEIIYQDHAKIYPETESEMKHYCESTISRRLKEENIENSEIFDVCYKRLLEIKRMSNLLRPHQSYTTLVLQYRDYIYPNRFIELF